MLNSLKIFGRNLSKQKTVSVLSVGSLAISIAVAVLIGLWALNEFSFDSFHKDSDKMYRVVGHFMINNGKTTIGSTYKPLGSSVKEQCPEVEAMCRVVPRDVEIKLNEMVYPDNQLLMVDSNFFTFFTFALKAGDPKSCLTAPDQLVVDEYTANRYFPGENPIGKSLEFFGKTFTMLITLLISVAGLFGMAYYATQRRLKEVGVRKVNGASVGELLLILNFDFFIWVGISFLIACPLAYLFMSRWLEGFTERTALSWWVFVLVGAITFLVTLLTVSFQTWKAANVNPVKVLKSE